MAELGTRQRAAQEVRSQIMRMMVEERRLRSFSAIQAMWRLGDLLRDLRTVVPYGMWRCVLNDCADDIGLHASSLSEALRAAEAFSQIDREHLLRSFEPLPGRLLASHVVALARMTPRHRRVGIQALLREPLSVRELRASTRSETS